MASAASSPRPSNVSQYGLAACFWTHTVAALSSETPLPRLDFLFDGYRAFSLVADGTELLLVDYEDVLESDSSVSKRGFEFDIDDDEAPGDAKRAFAREFPGVRASVDDAIEQVCAFYDKTEQWYETVHHTAFVKAKDENSKRTAPQLTVLLLRAVVRYDCEDYQVERRYRTVYRDRGDAMHSLSRQSDRCAELAQMGCATLDWLRCAHHTLVKVASNAAKAARTADDKK